MSDKRPDSGLGKDLIGLETLSGDTISAILDTAEPFKEISERAIKKVPVLRGKTIVNLFFEPSTRTRISFEFAEKRLGADTVNVAASGSSVVKGETLVDTARNLEAMRIDMVVIRHGSSGAAQFLADRIPSNVINGGDGSDTITGGPGADVITCGTVNDVLTITTETDSLNTSMDVVQDFTSGQDDFDVDTVPATVGSCTAGVNLNTASVASTGATAGTLATDIGTVNAAAALNCWDQAGDAHLITVTGTSIGGVDAVYLVIEDGTAATAYNAGADAVILMGGTSSTTLVVGDFQ